jgi:hypothetical protein
MPSRCTRKLRTCSRKSSTSEGRASSSSDITADVPNGDENHALTYGQRRTAVTRDHRRANSADSFWEFLRILLCAADLRSDPREGFLLRWLQLGAGIGIAPTIPASSASKVSLRGVAADCSPVPPRAEEHGSRRLAPG